LGAAGKGYAIDVAVAILRCHGVSQALLHGGTSSVHAIGDGAVNAGWRIAWRPPGGAPRVVQLHDQALSVSASHGKSYALRGVRFGHVIDARKGRPTTGAPAAMVRGPGSFECDALSTALLVRGASWVPLLRNRFRGYDGSVAPAPSPRSTVESTVGVPSIRGGEQ
jgi:thiamine biosynthesis lipoprotein